MAAPNRATPAAAVATLVCFSGISILRRGIALILLPLYLRYVPPDEYGQLAAITVAAGIFGLLASFKLDAAMRTFYFDYHNDPETLAEYVRQLFSTAIYFAGVLYIVMLLTGETAFGLLFAHDLKFFPAGALAFATAGAAACLSCYFVYLRNSLRLRELVAWEAALMTSTVALQLLFVVRFGLGFYGVLWASLLSTTSALLALVILRPQLLGAWPSSRYLKRSMQYATPLLALGICYALGTRLDRVVLEHYVTLETLGTYAVLAGLLGVLALVLDALDNTMRPFLYPAMRSAGTGKPLELYLGLYLFAGLLTLSGAIFLGSHLQLVTARAAYLDAQQWLPLGATAFVPMILTRYYALFYEFHKRSVELGLTSFLRLLTLGLLLVWWVPELGVRGALLALLTAETLNAVLFGLNAWRHFAISTSLPRVGAQLGLFLSVVWLLSYAVADRSMAAFGTLQLVIVAASLLAMNGRPLLGAVGLRQTRPLPSQHAPGAERT